MQSVETPPETSRSTCASSSVRVVQDRVGTATGDERPVGLVAAIREPLGHEPDALPGRTSFQNAPRLTQHGDAQTGDRVDDAARDLVVALGLVVKGAVRLDEEERADPPRRQSVQALELIQDEPRDGVGRDRLLDPAEPRRGRDSRGERRRARRGVSRAPGCRGSSRGRRRGTRTRCPPRSPVPATGRRRGSLRRGRR